MLGPWELGGAKLFGSDRGKKKASVILFQFLVDCLAPPLRVQRRGRGTMVGARVAAGVGVKGPRSAGTERVVDFPPNALHRPACTGCAGQRASHADLAKLLNYKVSCREGAEQAGY